MEGGDEKTGGRSFVEGEDDARELVKNFDVAFEERLFK